MEKAVKELKETEKVAVGVKERQKHAKTRRKKLEKSVQEDTTALRNAQHLITDSGERLDKNTANLEQYREELVEAEAELEKIQDGLRGKTAKFHKQIEQKQKELEPWTNKIDAKKTQLDVAQSERDTLVQRGEALKQAVAEAQETYKNLQEEQQEKLREQAECRTEKEKLKQLIAAATAKKQAAQKDVEEWRAKANSARSRVEEAKANQSANRSRSALLESLHSLKEQGRIHGFHGKLGDLGTIDDKYDVAISTAAGGSLANLIVDKVEQGRECIEYLRTNNLGRASFMILEKLSESPRMKKINTPEDVPRLFDLVKPKDPIYRKAFYKALGDTLVAQDTTQANRIAFGGSQRWRVVTLDGALIETSGAMSGGGAQPQRGAMNSKLATDVSPQQMRQWEKSSAEAAEMLQKAFREQQEADSELEKLQRAGPELDMRYQKLTLELETRKVRIAEAAKRFEDLKAQNKPNANDAARIRELEKQIEVHTASLEELQESADKITEAIQGLEREILKIGGAQLMLQKSKVEGLRTHIGLANEAIAKAETERNKATADVKRLTASVEANEKALVEVKEELAKLDEEVEEAEEFLTALRKTVEEAQNKTENQKDELDEIKQDLANAEEGLAKFKKKELEIKNKITDTKKIIDNCQEQIDDCTDRHDKLKLHDIDEEEDDSDDEEDGEHADGEGDGEGHDDGEGEPNIKPDPDAPPKQSEQLKLYGEDELRKMRKDALLADTELLDEKIKNSKVDLTVLKEYKKQQALFDNRAKELEEVTQQRDAKKAEYDGLRKQRLEEFMTGFNLISMKLKEMYQMITLGGNAELELVDSMDPFSEGIIFSVMPPKKSWKNISNLSGGEKTLSSLALVFALHVYKPTPLYFMDEIDAALDFRNVSIVANYIKDRTKNAQFIIISLRNDMFELSHRLIGIYKTNNATRSISIDNHKLLPTAPQQSTAAA
ncbi:hypothetical protein CC1G_13763 [Coprinopsis cinerea okayama7|uniref:Structural maintenance of chromosomes protein 4 n=1 Tax=Coprinopsis cinerea (strain Okayama-7 / 130 / ATCC MYA-4618 / FGSC 9003) TaxID=240176 RepID=D6RKB0_COPC7|nr:hypothetical protein CC1G_13763 [Coprinopsis cinerea okayama7\|eukprot:XP_002912231.1 hypothetical protein CC1G_13763 [Coprinopsis cinerea okayama7\